MALRPRAASAAVILGSLRVQSARSGTTPLAAKVAITSALCNATRLFTWQVTHHAAVKSTNTAVPCSVYRATFSADHSCQASSPALAACESAVPVVAGGHAAVSPAAA